MDLVDVVLRAEGLQLGGLLGREIGDYQPFDAGVDRVTHEVTEAVLEERVVVAHEHEGRLDASRPELADGVEAGLDGDAVLQGVEAGLLDRGAVGHGVAEGDADFEEVSAIPQDGLGNVDGRGHVGETDRYVRGKYGFPLGAGIAKRFVESV